MRIDKFVKGDPYPKHKVTGDIGAPERWFQAIVEQTAHLRKVQGPCRLEVEFVLPPDRFPADHPFGTDLDNLLKILMDSLKNTVLREAPGGDGAIIELRATKVKAKGNERTGARIVLTDRPWSRALE